MIGLYSANSQSALGFTGLLDEYGGAAAAYSVRRLSSSYSGSLIEVRRSSDNTTQNIGYDANGDLDTTALLSFVGAGDGFVRTWYDQSGNANNAQQTTTSEQPQIVNGGSIVLQGGISTLYFDGVNNYYKVTTLSSSINSSYFLSNLRMINDPIVGSSVFGSPATDNKRYWLNRGVVNVRNGGTTSSGDALTNFSTRGIVSLIFDNSTTTKVYENGGSVKNRTVSGSSDTDTFVIGDWGSAPSSYRPMEMNLSEFILYYSDNSANVTGIQTNQNDYYSIY